MVRELASAHEIAPTPTLRYPAGSIIGFCDDCGIVAAHDVCALAFSENTQWDSACPHCGGDLRIGVSKCEVCQCLGSWSHARAELDKCSHDPCDLFDNVACDLTEMVANGLLRSGVKDLSLKLWKAKGGMDFDQALFFLVNHPIYHGEFFRCTNFDAIQICSMTRQAESASSPFRNDVWEVWVESGPIKTMGGRSIGRP